jgi:predicted nucleic acid-binding protein
VTFLLDTNAVSAQVEFDPRWDAWLARLTPQDECVLCTIVIGELWFGAQRMAPGKRRTELETRFHQVLPGFRCEAVSEPAGVFYAAVKQARRAAGLSLDENDLWIAATAIALGATLVTHDADFAGIPRLPLSDWTV